jgi:hypothetical protein
MTKNLWSIPFNYNFINSIHFWFFHINNSIILLADKTTHLKVFRED